MGEIAWIQRVVLRVPSHEALVEICQGVLLDWKVIFLGGFAGEVFFKVSADGDVFGDVIVVLEGGWVSQLTNKGILVKYLMIDCCFVWYCLTFFGVWDACL